MADRQRGGERRRYFRINERLPVKFRVVKADNLEPLTDWLNGSTRNISRGGLCLELLSPDGMNDKIDNDLIEMEILLAGGRKAMVTGKVEFVEVSGRNIWNRLDDQENVLEVGVKFVESDKAVLSTIAYFIIQKYVESYGT